MLSNFGLSNDQFVILSPKHILLCPYWIELSSRLNLIWTGGGVGWINPLRDLMTCHWCTHQLQTSWLFFQLTFQVHPSKAIVYWQNWSNFYLWKFVSQFSFIIFWKVSSKSVLPNLGGIHKLHLQDLAFFDHQPPSVYIFYGIKVYKN